MKTSRPTDRRPAPATPTAGPMRAPLGYRRVPAVGAPAMDFARCGFYSAVPIEGDQHTAVFCERCDAEVLRYLPEQIVGTSARALRAWHRCGVAPAGGAVR